MTNLLFKTCMRCLVRLPVDRFYRHSAMADGYLGKCAECTRRDVQINRRRRLDEKRAYDRIRSKTRDWAAKRIKLQTNDPERARARWTLGNAVKRGKITKPLICEGCAQVAAVHGHHADYSKPLQVEWLCSTCHGRKHRKDFAR